VWAKLVQAVLIPLVQKSVVALFNWVKNLITEYFRKKKLKKDNDKKVKDYEESDNIADARDDFNKLP
jgi:hypothetical protein